MVRPRIISFLIPILILMAGVPSSAQGILEQMENDVSSIVNHTKSAVVSIYDARLPAPANRSELPSAQRMELADRLRDLRARRQALDAHIAQLQGKLKAGDTSTDDLAKAQKERSDLEAQILNYQRRSPDLQLNMDATMQKAYGYWVTAAPKSGSGFSIGDGYVVTTADVLEGMQNPVILTDDGLHIQARIVGIDPDFNVGLLQSLAKTTLPALPLGDSASVTAGHFAICIGNQSGQENSVALMMVGGVRKESINTGRHIYPSLIQIAGTVGAGVSGAPLVDSGGRVIGMMAAIPISQWTYLPAEGNQPPRFMVGGEGSFAPFQPDADDSNNAPPKHNLGVPGGSQNAPSPGATPPGNNPVPVPDVAIGGVNFAPATPQGNPPPPPVMKKHERRADPSQQFSQHSIYGAPPPMPAPFWRPPVTSEGFAIPINDIKPILEDLKAGVARKRVWIGLGTSDEVNTVIDNHIMKITPVVHIRNIIPDSPAARSGIQAGDYLLSIDQQPIRSAADVREIMLRLQPGQMVTLVVKHEGDVRTYTLKTETRPENIEQTDRHPEKLMPKPMPMAMRALNAASKECSEPVH